MRNIQTDQRHNLLRRPVPIHIYICNHEPPSLYNSRRLQRYAVPIYSMTKVYTCVYILLYIFNMIRYYWIRRTHNVVVYMSTLIYILLYYILYYTVPFRLSRDGGRERCRCIMYNKYSSCACLIRQTTTSIHIILWYASSKTCGIFVRTFEIKATRRGLLMRRLQSLRRGNHGHRQRTRIPLRSCACDSSSQSSASLCYYVRTSTATFPPKSRRVITTDLSAKSSHVSDAILALFYIEKNRHTYRRTLSFNMSITFPPSTGIRIHCTYSVCSPSEMFVLSSQNCPVLIIIVYIDYRDICLG